VANRKQRRAAARTGEQDGETPDLPLQPGDPPGGGPAQPFPDHEKDALFKAQMTVQQMVIGHWKFGLALIAVVLLAVLGFGLWEAHGEDAQRAVQAKIAKIDRKMPKENPLVAAGFSPTEPDANVVAQVQEGARRFEAIAQEAEGTGAVTAWMRAAAAWERAGDTESAKGAYASAHEVGASGVVGWSASSAYASALSLNGDVDGSVAILREMADSATGILGEQALLTLAELYEDAGRPGESRAAYTEFSTKHPQSVLTDRVNSGLARLGSGQ